MCGLQVKNLGLGCSSPVSPHSSPLHVLYSKATFPMSSSPRTVLKLHPHSPSSPFPT